MNYSYKTHPLRGRRPIPARGFATSLDIRSQSLPVSTCSHVKGKENHNTKNLTEVINQHCSRDSRENPYSVKKYMFKYYRSPCRLHEAVLVICLEGRRKEQGYAFSLIFLKGNQPFNNLGNVEFNRDAVFKYISEMILCKYLPTENYRRQWHFSQKSSPRLSKGYTQFSGHIKSHSNQTQDVFCSFPSLMLNNSPLFGVLNASI